jgi:hypothetical protein
MIIVESGYTFRQHLEQRLDRRFRDIGQEVLLSAFARHKIGNSTAEVSQARMAAAYFGLQDR